jgi:hypothetical protein
MVVVPADSDNDTSETTAAIADAAHPAPPPPVPLEEDVPCAGCGYNLRGLRPTGRCPECGRLVQVSILRYRARPPRRPPDPRWAREVVEGAAVSLVAFGLLVVICVVPNGWTITPYSRLPVSKTPERVVFLCVCLLAWVAAWYSAWKLGGMPPVGERMRILTRLWLARWTLTVYSLIPLLIPLTWKGADASVGALVLVMLLCGEIGGVALLLTVAALFRRVDRRWAARGALALALVNALAMPLGLGIPSATGQAGVTEMLLALRAQPYGEPQALRLDNFYTAGDPFFLAFVVVALLNAAWMTLLLRSYLPLARPPGQKSEAAAPSNP